MAIDRDLEKHRIVGKVWRYFIGREKYAEKYG